MSDQVLEAGVGAVVARCEARGQLHDEQAEILIADIHSVTIKVGITGPMKLQVPSRPGDHALGLLSFQKGTMRKNEMACCR